MAVHMELPSCQNKRAALPVCLRMRDETVPGTPNITHLSTHSTIVSPTTKERPFRLWCAAPSASGLHVLARLPFRPWKTASDRRTGFLLVSRYRDCFARSPTRHAGHSIQRLGTTFSRVLHSAPSRISCFSARMINGCTRSYGVVCALRRAQVRGLAVAVLCSLGGAPGMDWRRNVHVRSNLGPRTF